MNTGVYWFYHSEIWEEQAQTAVSFESPLTRGTL
jgi:hypothetical protein